MVSYAGARRISSVFRARRPKIRDVEVEVLSWRDGGGVTPLDVGPTPDGDTDLRRPARRNRKTLRPPASRTRRKRKRKVAKPKQRLQTVSEAAATPIPAAPRIETTPEPPEVVEAQEPLETEAAAAPAHPATELTCEILFWRGYVKSGFYARVFSEDGEPLSIHESPYFRLKGNGIPESTGEALAAHTELCESLERDGWRLLGTGQAWFEQSFRQPVTDAEERVQG